MGVLYRQIYDSPVGNLILIGEEDALAGLWRQEYCQYLPEFDGETVRDGNSPVLERTADWLDRYFAGDDPGPVPPLSVQGTEFQRSVWQILMTIPYGATMTYGEIAGQIAWDRGLASMSAQAVGSAVGRNPISILIPCHRVIGADGRLTGYAGGLWRKEALLRLEQGQPAHFKK